MEPQKQIQPNLSGWIVTASDDGTYLYVTRDDGSPGQIHIKAEDEGFVVDIWSNGDDSECIATTCATYDELGPEENPLPQP